MKIDDSTFVQKIGYVVEKRGKDLSQNLYFVIFFVFILKIFK